MPDDDIKRDIAFVRNNAQQKYVDALIKFHYRRILRSLTQMLSNMPIELKISKRE